MIGIRENKKAQETITNERTTAKILKHEKEMLKNDNDNDFHLPISPSSEGRTSRLITSRRYARKSRQLSLFSLVSIIHTRRYVLFLKYFMDGIFFRFKRTSRDAV